MKKQILLTPLLVTVAACASELPSAPSDASQKTTGGDSDSGTTTTTDAAQPTDSGATGGDGDSPTTVGGDGDSGAGVPGDGDSSTNTGGDGDATTPTGPRIDPRGTRYCDGEILHLGEIHLFNNEWTDEAADTCVFLEEDGTFGIEWTRGSTGSGDNPTYPNYPEAEFGINPWNASGADKSTTMHLPLQLKDFTSASMTVDVTTTTTTNNGWNLAFELWLSDTDPTLGPANPKAEIMVFLGNEPGYWPPDPVGGELNDGHNTYTLYESQSPWGEWDHYRQWRLGDTDGTVDFNGTLDIYAFLRHHLDNEGWDPNLWVTRFEIGNETFQNSGGKTVFRNLCFEVNGVTKCAQTE